MDRIKTKIARAKIPGAKVKSAKLEKDGVRLVWSFDLTTERTTDVTELEIDAKSGKIVSNQIESAAIMTPEANAEKSEKKRPKPFRGDRRCFDGYAPARADGQGSPRPGMDRVVMPDLVGSVFRPHPQPG